MLRLALQATAIVLYHVVDGVVGFTLLAMFFGMSYGSVMPL
jgi:hypothetical protein